MKQIGVVGAGVMGIGVAQSIAQSTDYSVVLVDLSEIALEHAQEEIRKNVRMQALFSRDKNLKKPDEIINKIQFTTDYNLLNTVDFVIENVTEKWEVKNEVYLQLDKICKDSCIFAINTSCISITKVAALTKRPDKVIGTHFMNPVPLMHAVEVIKGYHTSEETIQAITTLIKEMGKESIIVNDFPGFVSNRISHLFMNEAAFVVQDQVASPQDVDNIFKKCYSHKMGPLETADLIGLDTVVDSLDVLYENYQDPKFRCCPLLRKMVAAGLLGRKSGKGFYDYKN